MAEPARGDDDAQNVGDEKVIRFKRVRHSLPFIAERFRLQARVTSVVWDNAQVRPQWSGMSLDSISLVTGGARQG